LDRYPYNSACNSDIYFNGKFSNFSQWSFSFYLTWIWSNYMCFFWYYIDIKTQVNRNFTTSTFLFLGLLDEAWDHAVWYYSIPASIKINKKKTLSIILIHVITILNIVLINFYYDCKHLIVLLIIVECRFGLVQSGTCVSVSIIVRN
jgi:hypothetical protein